MKRAWMGVITVGAILSSGCSTAMGAALPGRGVRSGVGHAMTFQKGPVYTIGVEDYHSLADRVARRPSPTGPVGMATPRVWTLGPEDGPLVEWGSLGVGVRGLRGAEIRRLGLNVWGYAKHWAELGLGRSVADISHDPSIFTYVQFRVFQGGGTRMWHY